MYHFEMKRPERGTSAEHLAYITRKGCHAKRDDLVANECGNMPGWAKQDPEAFWKAADKYERKNGSAHRNVTISLPGVLTNEQNIDLAREIGQVLAANKPFQLAVHVARSALEGQDNPHVHLVISDRTPDGIDRSPEQTFRRYNAKHPERGGRRKDSGGMSRLQLADHMVSRRKVVADRINAALERSGHVERVDHRSLREQGKRRPPEKYLGPAKVRNMSEAEKQQYIEERRSERRSDLEAKED